MMPSYARQVNLLPLRRKKIELYHTRGRRAYPILSLMLL